MRYGPAHASQMPDPQASYRREANSETAQLRQTENWDVMPSEWVLSLDDLVILFNNLGPYDLRFNYYS